MRLDSFIAGIKILQNYYKDPNGYQLGAEHDIIYLYTPQFPITREDVDRLRTLGWFQPEVPDMDNEPGEYNSNEGWAAFT